MRSRLIHCLAVMQSIGGHVRNELANCEEPRVAGLINALREIEQFRELCSDALRKSRDMDDELAARVMPELIAEADRLIALSRLALNAGRAFETLGI